MKNGFLGYNFTVDGFFFPMHGKRLSMHGKPLYELACQEASLLGASLLNSCSFSDLQAFSHIVNK